MAQGGPENNFEQDVWTLRSGGQLPGILKESGRRLFLRFAHPAKGLKPSQLRSAMHSGRTPRHKSPANKRARKDSIVMVRMCSFKFSVIHDEARLPSLHQRIRGEEMLSFQYTLKARASARVLRGTRTSDPALCRDFLWKADVIPK